MAKSSFHCLISGKVQGVWFRASTKDRACELHLGGWVKNRSDGIVEVYACGESEDLEKLKHWLLQGPPLAQVTNIEYLPSSDELMSERFTVLEE